MAAKRVFILGGGAALGAHQVGAMRLLEQEGIVPDAIVEYAGAVAILSMMKAMPRMATAETARMALVLAGSARMFWMKGGMWREVTLG